MNDDDAATTIGSGWNVPQGPLMRTSCLQYVPPIIVGQLDGHSMTHDEDKRYNILTQRTFPYVHISSQLS